MTVVVVAVGSAGVVLVSAGATALAAGARTTGAVLAFALSAWACAALCFLMVLPAEGRRRGWTDLASPGVQYVVLGAAASALAGVVRVYALAYTAASLLLAWIQVAHARGLVRYDPTSARFATTRCALYAAIRAGSYAAAEAAGSEAAHRVALLVPLALATAETLLMVGSEGMRQSYAFGPWSERGAVYALLKSACFLALPVVETSLLPA